MADAVYHYLSKAPVNVNRGTYQDAYDTEEQIFETREQLLKLFHFSSGKGKNVIFTPNITTSLNVLLKGLLKPGDHVLVTSMEHNAVMRPLVQLTGQGVIFDRIPCTSDGSLLLEQAKKLLTPRTRLLVCLHASNVCGTIMPAREIGQFCREHGLLFILDTAQTAGTIPVDMEDFQISALAFTGHKGLRGPQGTGGFLIRSELVSQIDPLLSGETSTQKRFRIFSRIASQYSRNHFMKRFYGGNEMMLTSYFIQGILDLDPAEKHLRIIGKKDTAGRCPVVAPDPGYIALAAFELDNTYGIMTRVGLHCAPSARH